MLLARRRGAPVVIFDCNGVLVDSEQIAAAAAADEFARAGIPITPELVTRYFSGRRPADMLASVEAATGRKLPVNFSATLAAATLARTTLNCPSVRSTKGIIHEPSAIVSQLTNSETNCRGTRGRSFTNAHTRAVRSC